MGDCANRLINGIESIAKQLDQAHNIAQQIPTHWYTQSVTKQREKVLDVSLTPSAQVLKQMQDLGETHIDFGMRQSQKHANYYKQRNVDTETQERLMQIASDSLDSQRKIEQDSNTDFSSFLYAYYQQ
jgi:glutamate--cysteine ligase